MLHLCLSIGSAVQSIFAYVLTTVCVHVHVNGVYAGQGPVVQHLVGISAAPRQVSIEQVAALRPGRKVAVEHPVIGEYLTNASSIVKILQEKQGSLKLSCYIFVLVFKRKFMISKKQMLPKLDYMKNILCRYKYASKH